MVDLGNDSYYITYKYKFATFMFVIFVHSLIQQPEGGLAELVRQALCEPTCSSTSCRSKSSSRSSFPWSSSSGWMGGKAVLPRWSARSGFRKSWAFEPTFPAASWTREGSSRSSSPCCKLFFWMDIS
mmetsp:Transcript_172978/g.554607  ORF Transcript_172978/g.554607 Transcript_172978/m.554607 type:complete len:127 (+) Transcript_172978:239-619(+)